MTSSPEYIQVDWEMLGPTNGTATLVNMLREQRREIVDAGQGAELPLIDTDPELNEFLVNGSIPAISDDTLGITFFPQEEVSSVEAAFEGEYPTDAGGTPQQRKAVARLYQDILRFEDVSPDRAFLVQQLGRSILEVAFRQAALNSKAIDPIIALPEPSWSVLWGLAKHAGLKPVGYNTDQMSFPQAVSGVIDEHGPMYVAAVLVNSPRNPFSDEVSPEEMREMMGKLDRFNSEPHVNITAILDNPYGFFCDTGEDENGRFLKTGQEGVFFENSSTLNFLTPWISVNSFSKVLAAANIGVTPVAVSNEAMARDFTRVLNITGRITRDETLLSNIARLFDGEHDEMLWDRLDNLRAKYVQNRAALERLFPGLMVPGAPNMMAVLKIPVSDVFNRAVECCDGQTRVLEHGDHIVEHLANNHGVGVVNGGIGSDNSFLLRLALREWPSTFTPAMEDVARGLKAINPDLPIPEVEY